MPVDITMCPGEGCPQREQCYRYRGIPVGRQDWLTSAPVDRETGVCGLFWDVASLAPTEEQIRDRAYFLWQAAGQPVGQAEVHWRQAEQMLAPSLRDGGIG